MPKYHFDLVASKTIADEGGAEVCNDIGAMDIAQELARRLVKERPELKDRHYAILVSTEDGDEVGRAPLDPILKKSARALLRYAAGIPRAMTAPGGK
jgi:hypothetical protein